MTWPKSKAPSSLKTGLCSPINWSTTLVYVFSCPLPDIRIVLRDKVQIQQNENSNWNRRPFASVSGDYACRDQAWAVPHPIDRVRKEIHSSEGQKSDKEICPVSQLPSWKLGHWAGDSQSTPAQYPLSSDLMRKLISVLKYFSSLQTGFEHKTTSQSLKGFKTHSEPIPSVKALAERSEVHFARRVSPSRIRNASVTWSWLISLYFIQN